MMTSLSLSPPAWALDSVLDDELSISPPQGDESLAFLGGFDGEYAAEDPFAAADDNLSSCCQWPPPSDGMYPT